MTPAPATVRPLSDLGGTHELEKASDLLFGPGPIEWVQAVLGPGRELWFRPLDMLGTVWGIPFAIGIALWLWGRQDAYALAAMIVLEGAVYLLLQNLFTIPRPHSPEIVVYERVSLPSFPSGHAFTVTALWGLLWARSRIPFWLLAVIVLSVGWGRLYLGVHYLGDVIGGVVAGALLVWVMVRLWPRIRAWLARRPASVFTAGALLVAAGALLAAVTLFGGNYHRWNSAGVVAGVSVGFLLEYRRIGYRPSSDPGGRVLRLLVGAAGIVLLFLLDRLTGEGAHLIGSMAILAASAWATLGVPAVFHGPEHGSTG